MESIGFTRLLSVIIIGGLTAWNQTRVIDPTTNQSVVIRSSTSYPMPLTLAAGVSMGDGSALVCGGRKPDVSNSAKCNFLDIATLATSVAPPLPHANHRHEVLAGSGGETLEMGPG